MARAAKTGFLTRLLARFGFVRESEAQIMEAPTGVGWWDHHYRERKRKGPAASARQCTCPDPKVGQLCATIGGPVIGDHCYRIHTHRRIAFRCEHGCGCVMMPRSAIEPERMTALRVCSCGAEAAAGAAPDTPGLDHARSCNIRWNAHDWCPGNPVQSS